MALKVPGQYRVVNWWDYIGEEAPEGFDPTDPTIVNATWLMTNLFDKLINGEFATKSFNIVPTVSDLSEIAEIGQTAYVMQNDYINSFFIYNGSSWVNINNYTSLEGKPQINGVPLASGNNTLNTLGIQGKNLYFTNVNAGNWIIDTDETYPSYTYKCVLTGLTGVTSSMFAIVTFGPTEFDSGNYANVCLTGNGTITIYSKVSSTITIPTIIVMGV